MIKTLNRAQHVWIQLTAPTPQELERISHDFFIPFSMLNLHQNGAKSRMIERHAELFAFMLQLPIRSRFGEVMPFTLQNVSVIVMGHVVITISEHEHPILTTLEQSFTELTDGNATHLLLHLFEHTIGRYLLAIDEINRTIATVEAQIENAISNQHIFDLLNHNKSYGAFIRALKHNGRVFKDLAAKRLLLSDYKTDAMLQDVVLANLQTQKKVEIYHANLRNLMDAYSAAIENNLSLAVQYLTIFVTIAAIPMAIAGIYGMNTPLPFQDEPYALVVLGAIAAALAGAVMMFFKARRYL
ncbi:magnesium transporter CorA family protein [Wohlfahrtiimonas sp. G9077]|uniref:magnesium transporter CorA family protein n=1 Tax=Wohlfahrtiimonas sp. G9077 TaxID=1980118 RepID=UPI000B98BD1F|nr:magnesium transporter CorA family protein [Wohlfahrtiimonas sp. G9077]OYQ73387.1 hypothetical protein B9T20_06625 [Wohlfahrtiimonas sp. G9077]